MNFKLFYDKIISDFYILLIDYIYLKLPSSDRCSEPACVPLLPVQGGRRRRRQEDACRPRQREAAEEEDQLRCQQELRGGELQPRA